VRRFLPLLLLLGLWECCARFFAWPAYFIPKPSVILMQIGQDASFLAGDFLKTSLISLAALLLALLLAFLCATLTHLSKTMRALFYPLSLVLQVTPIIALAPLLLIYLNPQNTTLSIACLIAFYPLYTGLLNGFNAVNAAQAQLFTLYKATKWQKFIGLECPTALPFLYAGLEVASGLALVGTIVGEFTSGTGQGLAIRLLESQYRLNIPRVYACLGLIIVLGFLLRGGIIFIKPLLKKEI
jgi:NitT/TauT family transport system permease protein